MKMYPKYLKKKYIGIFLFNLLLHEVEKNDNQSWYLSLKNVRIVSQCIAYGII